MSANPQQNDPEPEVAYLGVHHGRELITAYQTMRLLHALTDGYGSDNQITKLVDTREVWVIPVVNPNGYERAVGSQIDWRKNTRGSGEAEALRHRPQPQRRFRPPEHVHPGATDVATRHRPERRQYDDRNLDPDSDMFPGPAPFSEVETQAVRGLAHSQFLTRQKHEVDGMRACCPGTASAAWSATRWGM